MAIRIPQAEASIEPLTPNIPTPQVATPVRGAFGENIAQAQEGFADVGDQIADRIQKHIEKQKKIKLAVEEESIIRDSRIDSQNKLFDEEIEKVKIDNVDIERKKGWLSRKRKNTEGILREYDAYHIKRIRDITEKIKDSETRIRVASRLNTDYINGRDNIVKHEATETRAYNNEELESSLELLTEQSAGAQNSESIKVNINDSKEIVRKLSVLNGWGKDKTELENLKAAGDIVKSSIIGAMIEDKTGATARHLLNESKDEITEGTRIEIEEAINKQVKANSTILKDDLNESFLNDELTMEMIIEASKPKRFGGIGGTSAKTLTNQLISKQKNILKPIIKKQKLAKAYVNAVDLYLDTNIEEFEAKEILVDAYANGLDRDDKTLLRKIRKNLKANKKNVTSTRLLDTLNNVRDWFNKHNKDDTLLKDAIDKIMIYDQDLDKTQEEMEDYEKEVLLHEKKRINPNAGIYEIKDVAKNRNGSWNVIGHDTDGEPLVVRA